MTRKPLFFSLCCLITLIHVLNKVLVNSSGLTLKLIHPDSPESPFSQSNLSSEERIKRLVSQSDKGRRRKNRWSPNHLAKTSYVQIRTNISVQNFHYIVKIGIGTFKSKPPYKEYYVEMDTGSNLVWMQCEGCTRCYNQTPKPFPKQNSSSFHPVLVGNELTNYELKYEDGASTHGIMARETFYLTSNTGGLARIENLEFGCGLDNFMQFGKYKNNKIAGIMGLGWDDLSFVKQLGPPVRGIFSYCLPVVSSKTPSTYLRFGEYGAHHQNSKSTPLYRRHGSSTYNVELQGISVNRTRLNIRPEVFALKNSGRSGCVIDSGTPYSRIITPAFDILKVELEKYFSKLKGLKKIKGGLGLELCYERSKKAKYEGLPDITLHLRGADFFMKPEAVFEVVTRIFSGYFCLAMVRDSKVSIIGSHQQTNQRMIHDTNNKRLVFYADDCSKNP